MANYISSSSLATLMVVLVVALSAPAAESAVTCSQVISAAGPCLQFLRTGGAVSPSCCSSLRSFYAVAAKNTPDLQASCSCIKSLATSLSLNPAFINQLPVKCAVNIPYKFTPTIDCTRIH